MSNPRDHHTKITHLRAKIVLEYVANKYNSYPTKYQSQLKTDIAQLRYLLDYEATDHQVSCQIDNVVEQCLFAEEALGGKGIW